MDPSEHPGSALVLGAGVLYGVVEATFGLVLILATTVRGHPPAAWLEAVKAVSKADVGAFGPRWLLHATAGLQRTRKLLVGVDLVVEGSIRASLLVGVARGVRPVTVLAAVAFAAVALGGVVAAGTNPPIGTLVTAVLNVAVAVVVALELHRLLSQPRLRAG
ncbi:MAG: hypothetical protein JO265_08305 [Acidimicrobiia bacterium]|nr:hypothetical protein [Acidimicrobiia bacterium]